MNLFKWERLSESLKQQAGSLAKVVSTFRLTEGADTNGVDR